MQRLCANCARPLSVTCPAVLALLGQIRRTDDLRNLREALFSAISQIHGHGVARARVAPLDPWLHAVGGAIERRGAGGGRR